jgi:ubiquinone/menaquinone biosynthesis C-methylase UbiE
MMNPAELANIARFEQDFWWYRGMERILFRMLDRVAPRSAEAVEAGCGTGHISLQLETRYGWRMFPLDLEPQALAFAAAQGCRRLTQADIASLPFADRQFDAALSLDVMVYVPRGQEAGVIRELVRVIAPGGLLVLRTAALEMLRSHHAEFTGERQRFTRSQIMQIASGCGLKILRCTYANSLLLPIALVKFRLIEPLMVALTGRRPESGVQPISPWLDRLLYSVLKLEAWWLGLGRSLPIGQSLILIGERIA